MKTIKHVAFEIHIYLNDVTPGLKALTETLNRYEEEGSIMTWDEEIDDEGNFYMMNVRCDNSRQLRTTLARLESQGIRL